MAGIRRGTFTCVGWQVTLCDPIWQVTSHSSEVGFPQGRAISALAFLSFFYRRTDERWKGYGDWALWYELAKLQPMQRSKSVVVVVVVVVVIAQQLISYRQLSRLRKSATTARLWVVSDDFDSSAHVLQSVLPLHTPDKHLICHWWFGPCMFSRVKEL